MRDYSVDVSKQVIDLISAEVKTFVKVLSDKTESDKVRNKIAKLTENTVGLLFHGDWEADKGWGDHYPSLAHTVKLLDWLSVFSHVFLVVLFREDPNKIFIRPLIWVKVKLH